MNFKNELTSKEIEYLLSLVESDYEEVAQYVDSKELEKEDKTVVTEFEIIEILRWEKQ